MKILFTLIRKRSFLLPVLLFVFAQVRGQETPVTIKVVNQKKEPVTFASITITDRADSTHLFKQVADSNGTAIFKLQRGGQYSILVTSVNYQSIEKGFVVTGSSNFFSFIAEPLPKTLGDVTVTSKKPLMRQEDDKLIIDPEPLVGSSTNGYEVIEKTPGLFVDQDGNIYISSLTPATVYINGREMKMSTADVATMLKSLPPNAISRIEVLKTPSAKYDATAGGGIVNVVLRKGVKIGMTGSVYTGMQQGTYGNRFVGFSLNNNNGKKTSYINLNYNRRNSLERIITDRQFVPDSMLSQNAKTIYHADGLFVGYGLLYDVSKKWEVDFTGNVGLNYSNNDAKNQNTIRKISTGQLASDNLNKTNNKGSNFNVGNGVEAKMKVDSLGSEWTTDIFYSYADNGSDQAFTSNYSFPVTKSYAGDGHGDNKRDFFYISSDLKLKMKKKFTLETGGKVSIHNYRNTTDYFVELNGNRVKDPGRTNTFRYNENINSFYLQGAKTFGKDFIIKVGTRMENTNMSGHQFVPADTTFDIHRTDLFPYIYLSKNLMKIAGYDLRAYLVYRRTISRPGYDQLNPFRRYVDEYLTETGNPTLRPQFTQNYEANVSVDERPILAIGVNDTKDIFTNVIYQSDTSQSQAFRTYDNLGKNKEWYFRGLGAIPPGGKYFFVLGAQYNHNFYQGLYENKPLSFKKGTWTFFTYHQLKLDKRSMLTLNGFIRLKGQQQFYELSSFGALNTSINRQFFKQKLTVTLSANDIFYTNKNDFTINQGSVKASGTRMSDTRRFGINLRYNFGIRKKEENNPFNVESPEKTN